jgi:hypothetical protein
MTPPVSSRIIEELRRSSAALGDRQLAARLAVPRQAGSTGCRALERAGRLRRDIGPAGKIVNDARAVDLGPTTSERLAEVPAGDSLP